MLVLCSLALLSVVRVDALFTVFPEACVSQDGNVCVDDTTTSAGNTMDLKAHCCTRGEDGYLGAGATYHDGKSCQDLGFHKNKGAQRMDGGDTYAVTMCGGNRYGINGNCRGADLFASCAQQLTMWTKLGPGVAIWRGEEEDTEEAVAEEASFLEYHAEESAHTTSLAVNLFAAVGLSFVLYGAFRHFIK